MKNNENELRKVEFKLWIGRRMSEYWMTEAEKPEIKSGFFHLWEQNENGTYGIIEQEDGKIFRIFSEDIKFLSCHLNGNI